jgi:anti-sigma regulatory factor (Ser/Thr protein kinase)
MRDESTVVRLAIPAAPEFLRLARLAAADVASRAGFSFEDIEDLRIGVDELCHLLMAPGTEDDQLQLTFTLQPETVTVEGEGPSRNTGDPVVVQSELSQTIVTAVVDEHEVSRDGSTLRFRLKKHAPTR